MKAMVPSAFKSARNYVMTRGRPLDQARFRYHFEAGPPAAVIQALLAFQNGDGGFGHALEPDLRTAASSAIATTTGLAIAREVDAPADAPVVINAIRYLLDSYDQSKQVWPIVPPAVEDAPHAPWWNYAESAATFGGFRINPRAVLLGHLYHFAAGQQAAASLLELASQSLRGDIEGIAAEEMGMNDLLALLELAEVDQVPPVLRRPLLDKLRLAAGHVVENDPARWQEYTLRPLQVAPSPDALLAPVVDRQAVEANLDYLVDGQAADGSWELAWSWDFVDPVAWAQAEQDWKGFLAVSHLRVLAAYGRLAA
jgi:hypothetical protein